MPSLQWQCYDEQAATWPAQGRCILAQYNNETIVVYQAFRPEIASWACEHQRFGGPFSFTRMSWIKPNFLWMMYRCGWARKEGQERVLAVHVRRSWFESILMRAVASTRDAAVFGTEVEWQAALKHSSVRLQWDPDHGPFGQPVARRAIQLGLRNDALRSYAEEAIERIEDITEMVHTQRTCVERKALSELMTPAERVYAPGPDAAHAISLSEIPS